MSKLYHFYHVYADGKWKDPLISHIAEVIKSDLISHLDQIKFGIVGNEQNVSKVLEQLNSYNFQYEVIMAAAAGWEQLTLEHLKSFCKNSDGFVLYCHTKGGANPTLLNSAWRESMTHWCITHWKSCVAKLEGGCDTVGSHWYIDMNCTNEYRQQYGGRKYWAGNFWWANAGYIRTIPSILYTNRWDAEKWIGASLHQKIHDFSPGGPLLNSFRSDLTKNPT